nr:three-finger toxin [Malpolon monspessulanus]
MKTQLLALVVVAFVCLDLAHTRSCCTGLTCFWGEPCPDGENICFKRKNETDILGLRAVRGCAAACPAPIGEEKVCCCAKDNCNK